MAMEIKVGFEQTAQTLDVAFSNAQVFNSTYIPPIATTDEVGLVKPDGETITISEDGTITATAKEPSVATTETAGIVKPDGSTVTVDADGTIHAVSETVEVVQTTGDSETAVMSQKAVTDALANVGTGGETASGIPFIAKENISIISMSNVALKWAVDGVNNITTPTDGMVIALRVPAVGSGFGIVLSIDGGVTYYPLVRDANTKIYTELDSNSTAILTFNASQTVPAVRLSASGSTTVTGCWQISDKNTDQYVKQNYITANSNYALLLKNSSGITSNSSSAGETSYTNNIYANPSTGTMYANDFVVGGQSLDQRLQAVENLLAGVGVAEEGEF